MNIDEAWQKWLDNRSEFLIFIDSSKLGIYSKFVDDQITQHLYYVQ